MSVCVPHPPVQVSADLTPLSDNKVAVQFREFRIFNVSASVQ